MGRGLCPSSSSRAGTARQSIFWLCGPSDFCQNYSFLQEQLQLTQRWDRVLVKLDLWTPGCEFRVIFTYRELLFF